MLSRLVALFILFLVFPIFLIVGFFIFIEDGFPIFFKQKRFGINNTLFYMYKFRSMKRNTPDIATHLLLDSQSYLLKIGYFIRKTSLDELPNLINIIKGQMLFVGPRPALHNQDDLMSYRSNFGITKLKPGITGWAQINGRDEIPILKKVFLEKEYMERKSLNFDLYIIFRTVTYVLWKKGIKH
jgi:O-antigen biosynthesis protein WbqP